VWLSESSDSYVKERNPLVSEIRRIVRNSLLKINYKSYTVW